MAHKTKARSLSNALRSFTNFANRFGTGNRTEFKASNFPGPADKGINIKTAVSLALHQTI